MKLKTKIIIFSSVIGVVWLAFFAYLALIYVPGWYAPVYVDPADQQRLRDDLTAITTQFNNGMQHPESFDLKISAKDINRFISGVGFLDPRLKNGIPAGVEDPAVQLEDDYLKAGAVVDHKGKRVFASVWIKVTAHDEWLVLDSVKAKIGMYPVPRDTMQKQIEKISGKLARSFPMVEEILNNGQYPNRFRYPNSPYDCRVTHLRAIDGVLYLTIQPISRLKK